MRDDKWHGHGIFDQDCLKCRIAELEAERDKLRVGVMAEAVAISNLTAPSDTALRSVATRLAELLGGEG